MLCLFSTHKSKSSASSSKIPTAPSTTHATTSPIKIKTLTSQIPFPKKSYNKICLKKYKKWMWLRLFVQNKVCPFLYRSRNLYSKCLYYPLQSYRWAPNLSHSPGWRKLCLNGESDRHSWRSFASHNERSVYRKNNFRLSSRYRVGRRLDNSRRLYRLFGVRKSVR